MKQPFCLGVSVFHDSQLPFREFCDLLMARGAVGWVEVKLEPLLYYQGMTDDEAAACVRAVAARLPVSLHALHLELNAGSVNPGVRGVTLAELKRSVDIAARVAPGTVVTVHPGDNGEAPAEMFATVRQNTVEVLGEVAELARRRGVRLSLENRGPVRGNAYKYGRTLDELSELRSRLGNDVYYTVDVGHLTFVGAEPADYVRRLGPGNVAVAHLHNNHGREDEHGSTDEGLIDYGSFLSAYRLGGWTFPLVIEVKSMRALARSIAHLSAAWDGALAAGPGAAATGRTG